MVPDTKIARQMGNITSFLCITNILGNTCPHEGTTDQVDSLKRLSFLILPLGTWANNCVRIYTFGLVNNSNWNNHREIGTSD